MLKTSILFLFLFFINGLFAQTSNQNLDWKALNYFDNGDYENAIKKCLFLLEKQEDGIAKDRTKFILARSWMEIGSFDKAVELLSSLEFDAKLLKSGVPGLIGDCKSEQEKYSEALDYYTKAIHAEWNEGTTPVYLLKAFLCENKLGNSETGQRYIQTIIDYFPEFSEEHQIEKYLFLDDVSRIKLSIPEVSQPSTLGKGTINGKRVSDEKFMEALTNAHEYAKQSAQMYGTEPEDVNEKYVWDDFVRDRIRTEQIGKLGFRTDEEELMAYLLATDGFELQQEFQYYYTDESGKFDPDLLLARINEMKNTEDFGQRETWKATRTYYYRKLLMEKYHRFVTLIVYVNSMEVERKTEDEQRYTFKYRRATFSDLGEIEISTSDNISDELYNYILTSPQYQIEEDSRKLLIVEKEIKPSKEDKEALFSELRKLKTSFEKTDNDSLFIVSNAGDNSFTVNGPYATAVPSDHRKASEGKYMTFPDNLSNTFEEAKVGDVIGPYFHEENGVLAKVIGHTDEIINARHILLSVHGEADDYTFEDAQKMQGLVNDENFSEFAKKYSGDAASKEKGGSLGDFFFGDMVPTFATFCADAKIGDIGLVESQFGFHIVQVTKRSGKRLTRLAIIQRPIEITDATRNAAKTNIEKIEKTYRSEKSKVLNENYDAKFNAIVKKNLSYTDELNLIDHSPRVFDLGSKKNQDSILKFAYNSETSIGDISPIFEDNNRIVLALLASTQKKGPPTSSMIQYISLDMQFDQSTDDALIEEVKNHTPQQVKDLSSIALASLENPRLPGLGLAPLIIAKTINGFKNGENGFYLIHRSEAIYIEVISKSEPVTKIDAAQLKTILNDKQKTLFTPRIDSFLINSSVIIDNRDLNRLGVRP